MSICHLNSIKNCFCRDRLTFTEKEFMVDGVSLIDSSQTEVSSQRRFVVFLLITISLLTVVYFFFYNNYSFQPISKSLIKNIRNSSQVLNEQKFNGSVESVRCVVTVRKSEGRLGNRLFMIASAYGLARLHSCHLYLSPVVRKDVENLFRLDFSSTGFLSTATFDFFLRQNHSKSMRHIEQNLGCLYIKELSRPNAIEENEIFELTGFWQSYLHFLYYRDEILEKVFLPRAKLTKFVAEFFVELYEKYFNVKMKLSSENYLDLKREIANFHRTTWIGIHIRRKDFLGLGFSSSDEYLFNATNFILSRYPNAFFIIASDDRQYSEMLFPNRSNFVVTPSSFSIEKDFLTLILCEHMIITGGTFGWWTAFLNDGLILHDRIYPSGCDRREHYYPPWFLISGNVRSYKNSPYTNR